MPWHRIEPDRIELASQQAQDYSCSQCDSHNNKVVTVVFKHTFRIPLLSSLSSTFFSVVDCFRFIIIFWIFRSQTIFCPFVSIWLCVHLRGYFYWNRISWRWCHMKCDGMRCFFGFADSHVRKFDLAARRNFSQRKRFIYSVNGLDLRIGIDRFRIAYI